MGGLFRPRELDALVPQMPHVDAFEESLPRAEKNRRNGDMQLIDQARTQVLPDGVRPSVTKWNVVPPSILSGARAWWVRTKTGT